MEKRKDGCRQSVRLLMMNHVAGPLDLGSPGRRNAFPLLGCIPSKRTQAATDEQRGCDHLQPESPRLFKVERLRTPCTVDGVEFPYEAPAVFRGSCSVDGQVVGEGLRNPRIVPSGPPISTRPSGEAPPWARRPEDRHPQWKP